ncbi:hypothetical protein AN216_15195 [Streptomyces oceani]|uniref:VWFA domain-containing protein n=2 Tax=Streptomyces oceani TaxID=1075402 RepID=A0A1E7KG85_9ACTN|nr:hypothetical protein AN216_15195 [Streptomyces oceani]
MWLSGRRLVAGLLVGGMLLTGCTSTGGGSSDKATDAQQDGAQGGAEPAPPPDQQRKQEYRKGDEHAPVPPDLRSTFALDVDTASYEYARRTIREGRMPPPSTVRPEEFVNSFRQGYQRPAGDGFSVSADGARVGAGEWSLLRVGLATQREPAEAAERRKPAALTFVIDVSGSMSEPGRLDLVKHALRRTVDELRSEDSVALVTFSGDSRTVLPMTGLGDEGQRADIRSTIEGLEPADSTNLAAGVRTGYAESVAGKREGATNRVVLLSDALANTGETSADSILEQVREYRATHGITLFGVGVGSDYGDALMERLTNQGDGHTSYVSSRREAEEVFVRQLPRNIRLRARDAKAQVTFDPDNVAEQRLVGYDNRRIADQDFRDDAVDGGETGPGHTVTALYAVRLAEGADGHVATATVRWQDPDSREPYEKSRHVDVEVLDDALWESADPRLRTVAAAAYFAEALRGAERDLRGAPALGELAEHVRDAASETDDPQVVRLARTIDRADALD